MLWDELSVNSKLAESRNKWGMLVDVGVDIMTLGARASVRASTEPMEDVAMTSFESDSDLDVLLSDECTPAVLAYYH